MTTSRAASAAAHGRPHPPMGLAIAVIGANFGIAVVIAILHLGFDVKAHTLYHDPNALARQAPWSGAYSLLGSLTWAAGAAVALFGYALTASGGAPATRRSEARRIVLGLGGLFMVIGAIDDTFMIHETFMEAMVLAEEATFAGHAVMLAGTALAVQIAGPATRWPIFLLACAAFAVSIFIDLVEFGRSGEGLVEEVCKMTGISLLAAYLAATAADAIREAAGAECRLNRAGRSR